MKHFDEIYEIAEDNYGIVTSKEAAEIGVSRSELSRYVKAGWLSRSGNGVYKLVRHTPGKLDSYAEAVALVGPGSWIHGESVLAMCDLALASPSKVQVATDKRLRKKLPDWISVVRPKTGERPVPYEGIPSQSVADAVRASKLAVLPERLSQAVEDAARLGLITEKEAVSLHEELGEE